jgi:hypothetical protein
MAKNKLVNEHPLIWKLNTPQLICEVGDCCRDAGALLVPLKVLQRMLKALAEYAAKKNDPELNIHMLRLGLYDVHPFDVDDAIIKQVNKLKKGKEQWMIRLKGAV